MVIEIPPEEFTTYVDSYSQDFSSSPTGIFIKCDFENSSGLTWHRNFHRNEIPPEEFCFLHEKDVIPPQEFTQE